MSSLDKPEHLPLIEALRAQGEPTGKVRRLRRNGERAADGAPGGQADPSKLADTVLDASGENEAAVPNGRGGKGNSDRTFPAGEGAVEAPYIEALPQRRRSISWGGLISFLLCVVLPTLLASVYYLWIASDQYVVEWRFAVRDSNTATTTSSAAVTATTLSAILGGSTAASAPDNYMVTEYIKSGQAVADLERRINLTKLYSRSDIDFLSRLDGNLPIEKVVRYWQYMASASFDIVTGNAIAEVRAFTAKDALLIADTLVELTEDLINGAVLRPQLEAVRYAEAEVRRAEDRVKKNRLELAEYRNGAAVIEPNSSVVLSNATLASTLRQLIAQYQTDLAAMLSGGVGQNASQVQSLRLRIKATQEQLKAVEAEVRSAKQGDQSLSEVVGRYEQLDAERQFALAMLTSTMQSLEQARSNSMARRLFVVPYVRPALPQSSVYPNRPVAIATVAGACLLLWTIALLLGRSIREHLA